MNLLLLAATITATQPVTTNRWEGWVTCDMLVLRAVATWSDGLVETNLTRAGTSPRWTCDYGWFEKTKTGVARMMMEVAESKDRYQELNGPAVLWSTAHGEEGRGVVSVSYGGATGTFAVVAHKPTATGNYPQPPDYSLDTVLPARWNYLEGVVPSTSSIHSPMPGSPV